MTEMIDKSMNDFKIRSYGDFRRLIRGQTSKSMHQLYDDLYFKKHVGDKDISESYFNSQGLAETKYTQVPLRLAEIKPGERIIDIGCGRGEIVFQAAKAGAFAVGVDYAESAIEIASHTREKQSLEILEKTSFVCSSAEKLEFEDDYFDTAFLLDVVEHVSKAELMTILQEIRRILKPGGKLIIHTSPNLWSRRWGYRMGAVLTFLRTGKIPIHPVVAQFRALKNDPEYDEHKILLHINEQSIYSLKKNLKSSGFSSHIWLGNTGNRWILHKDFIGKALSTIYKLAGLKYFLGWDIYAVANPEKMTND